MSLPLPYCAALGIILVSLIIYKDLKNKLQIHRWKKALNLKNHQKTFHGIYKSTNGFQISKQARLPKDAPEYTYGEIEFVTFIALLSQTNINQDTIFYDLGSGTGKAVLACAMVFPVKKACGIELFTNLYKASRQQRDKLSTLAEYQDKTKNIQFINSDFLEVDFSDANLIFINATAFIGDIWEKLNAKLAKLPSEVTIFSASKKLVTDRFSLVKTTRMQMSWGVVYVYVYSKVVAL